jgi:hypothetical protein
MKKLYSFNEFLNEAKKKDEVEVDVTKAQQAYYKDLPKSTASKKKSQIAKQSEMDDDDPDAYKELPGDKKAQQQGKVKTSKYTDAYNKKYGKKNESVNEAVKPIKLSGNLKKDLNTVTAMAEKMVKYAKDNFNTYIPTGEKLSQLKLGGTREKDVLEYNIRHLAKAINTDLKKKYMKDFVAEGKLNEADKKDDGKADEKLLNQGPIKNPDIEKALKKKQEDTGVDIKILRAVMRKGMAAWKSGHRPGATQEQWGYARVNSFLTGGKTIGTKANPGPDGRLGKMAKLI